MDHERVAALHDGKLDAHERDELLAAIAADDDQSWLFAETAGVLADLEAAHAAADDGVIPIATRRPPETPAADAEVETAARRDDGVIPIDSRRRSAPRRWMAYGAIAAALAGIGVTAALLSRSGDWRPDDPVLRAVALLEDGARGVAPGWKQPWSGERDADPTAPIPRERLAVQMGAHLVDLELAAAANDTVSLHRLSGRIAVLFDQGRVNRSARTASIYRDIEAGGAERRGDLRERLAAGRDGVRGLVGGEWLELGIWAEAARTAAVRGDAEFFHARDTRRALDRALVVPGSDDSTRKALVSVRNALPARGTPDFTELRRRLDDLLSVAGDASPPPQ